MSAFLYPAFFIKQLVYEKAADVLSFDSEVANLDGFKKDYLSALYKVSTMNEIKEFDLSTLFISELVHVQNEKADVLRRSIDRTVSLEARIKNLNSI